MTVSAESLSHERSWSVAIWQPEWGHGLTPIKRGVDKDGAASWYEDNEKILLTFDEAADMAYDYANHARQAQDERLRDRVYLIGSDGSQTEIVPSV